MVATKCMVQFRLKEEEKECIKQAAKLTGITMSQFVLRAALIEAQHLLGDRTQFVLDVDRFNAFTDALGQSPEPNDALNKFLHAASPWD